MDGARKFVRLRPQRDYKYRLTLGVDWGSEAVRASLLRLTDDGQIIEKLCQHSSTIQDMMADRQEVRRQYTSHIYPFDHSSPNPPAAAVYPGNKRLMSQRSISSKLAMYPVVGISDDVAIQSEELSKFCEEVEKNPQLKDIIRIGIEQMLVCVLQNIHSYIAVGSDLDAIALTIPAQWTIEFEEEYGDRITAAWYHVFGCAPPQIIFLSEGQTNAHYAFWRRTATALSDRQHNLPGFQQDFFSIGETKNAVLIIDAGGHSTNTSLVTVCEDGNQLEIRPDRGAIGGTAMWAMRALETLKEKWAREVQIYEDFTVEMENQTLKNFYSSLTECNGNQTMRFDISGIYTNRQSPASELTSKQLVEAFDTVHASAFGIIEDGIRQLKFLEPSCERIEIVIGGGSAQGSLWVDRMMSLCAKHQLKQPIFLWQIDQLYEYARLAGGANYALAEAKSVPQFVSKAAFGLVLKKRYKGENGWTRQWDCQATLIWAKGQKWTRVFKNTGDQEFKVICQPEFDDPQDGSMIQTDFRAYDILPITRIKRGSLKFDFEVDDANDTLKLTINHKKFGKSKRWTELGTVQFDLWVPPGSRCLQIWECVEDIQARVAAAFSPDQQPAAVDQDVEMADVEAPEDVEMGGMEAVEEMPGGSITVEGSEDVSRPRRRGATVATGIFARSGSGLYSSRM